MIKVDAINQAATAQPIFAKVEPERTVPRVTETSVGYHPDAAPPEPAVTSPLARVPDHLDPDRMADYLSRVAEAIRNATDGPHLVGFRRDPDTGDYLIEIRDRDGELVTTLAPQKNLNRSPVNDEFTGMVVDRHS